MSEPSRQQGGVEPSFRSGASDPSSPQYQRYLSVNRAAQVGLPPPAGHMRTSPPGQSTSSARVARSSNNLASPSAISLGSSKRSVSFASLFSRTSTPPTAISTPATPSCSNPPFASGSKLNHASSSSTYKFRQVAVGTCEKLETALRGLQGTASLLPPVKSVIDQLIECVGGLQAIVQTEDIAQLGVEIQSKIETLDALLRDLNPDDDNALLEDLSVSVKARVDNLDKMRGHRTGRRLLESKKYEEELVKCSLYMNDLIQQLQSKTILQTRQSTNTQLAILLLRSLSPAHEAPYNSEISKRIKRHGCTSQTREAILCDLENWAQDSEATKLYWMSGMAGTGKTTIAYSLCDWLKVNGLLGASFFCTSSSTSCRSVGRIVPTIAHQLSQSLPLRFQSDLCNILNREPNIPSDIEGQFEKLLERPLIAAREHIRRGMVIVIDALDECQDQREGRSRMREFFEALSRFAARLPLKFFLTSRPDSALYDQVLPKQTSPTFEEPTVHLHEIERSLVEADITTYLTNAFSVLTPPPSLDRIKLLTKRAGKLFIYAATVVHFVISDTTCGDSSIRLESVLSIPQVDNESCIKYKELDLLYLKIISTAFRGLLKSEKNIRESVLRTSICAGEPLTITTLASLMGHTEQQVISALQPLQSLLYVTEASKHISPFHSSFPEFMLDRTRSHKYNFNRLDHSLLITERCFEVMMDKLTFNICQLESSFVFDKNIPDLEGRVTTHIPPVLDYACNYWSMHLGLSRASDTLCNIVSNFMSHGLLFWMEVLNLKGCIHAGPGILLQAENWFLANSTPSDTAQFIAEARLFVARFAISACALSTPHLYISALPLCPKSSLVHKTYSERIRENQTLRFEGADKLQSKQATLLTLQTPFMRNVMAVAFSPDGSQIASGSKDGHVRLWRAHTGEIINSKAMKHNAPVLSVAFSPDGTRLVSGSIDCTIRIWDVNTFSETIEAIKEHTDWIRAVGFSPDSELVASGSHDRTVRIWNSRTGRSMTTPLRGHTQWVASVAFSPNGTQIVSTSDDFTTRFWDSHTGCAIGHPWQGHKNWVRSVAYSPDGSLVASGSHDKTILVRNARTGALIVSPLKGHTGPVNSIAFSADGNRIVSGSDDRTIRMWDTCSGALIAGPLKGHNGPIRSIAFSPDSSKFVSASDDCTIRVWDANTVTAVTDDIEHLAQGHSKSITAIALSSDGERIASGSHDCTILIWSVKSGRVYTGPLQGHTDSVVSIAFSPDEKHIASGSNDCTVLIWDAHTGILIARPCIGHILSVKTVAFSPNGIWIASGSDDCTIRLWDAVTGDQVAGPFTEYQDHIRLVAFSADGSQIVSSSADHTVQVWDLGSGRIVGSPCKQGMYEGNSAAVAFSSDGTRLAYGVDGYSIRVRDVRTGALVGRKYKGHTSTVTSVALSANGSRMVSGSSDLTIRVWELNQPTNTKLSNPWRVNNNGWITTGNSALFWVPPDLHERIPHFPGTLTLGPEGTSAFRIERWDILGEGWTKCYNSG